MVSETGGGPPSSSSTYAISFANSLGAVAEPVQSVSEGGIGRVKATYWP